jgi:rare lipoprotein A
MGTRTASLNPAQYPPAQYPGQPVAREYQRVAPHRVVHYVKRRPVSVVRRHAPDREQSAGSGKAAGSQGVASFYTEDQLTANGEKFNTHDLTAAHPTLPFGTRLRVTNVATGRSVTVRVNDRGPYVPGRVVDVSYSAAEALGMVDRGVAKVKLDVVR